MPYRVTQYDGNGYFVHSKVTRFKWRARFWAWLYGGTSIGGTFKYRTEIREVES